MQREHAIDVQQKAITHDHEKGSSRGANARTTPPEGLPVYRLFTGKDDAAFCKRVSEALSLGYKLYGSPSVTFNGTDVIAAQAVLWRAHDLVGSGFDDETPL